MPELSADVGERSPLHQEERRVCVPEVVESEAWDLGLLQGALEHLRDLALVEGMSRLVREEPFGLPPPSSKRLRRKRRDMSPERADEAGRQIHAAGGVRLRVFQSAMCQGSFNPEGATREVEVARLKRERLARPKPRLGQ